MNSELLRQAKAIKKGSSIRVSFKHSSLKAKFKLLFFNVVGTTSEPKLASS